MYYNYKGGFSTVLMAVSDARYKILYADSGSYGHELDGGIFNRSAFKKCLDKNFLNLPPPDAIPGTDTVIPHFFLGDMTFPLLPNLLKSFPDGKALTKTQRIFNYRYKKLLFSAKDLFNKYLVYCDRF